MLLPGPEATQLATYIGWLMHRTWGGLVAGILFVLPSLVVLIALSWLYLAYGNVPVVAGVLYGIKPAVVAIVLHAAWRIGSRALKHPVLWVIAAAAFVAIFAFDVPFPGDRRRGGDARRARRTRRAAARSRAAARTRRRPPRIRPRSSTTPRRRRRTRAIPPSASRRDRRVVLVLWARRAGRARASVRLDARLRRWAGSSPRRRC